MDTVHRTHCRESIRTFLQGPVTQCVARHPMPEMMLSQHEHVQPSMLPAISIVARVA
jgi:hypothetical protein